MSGVRKLRRIQLGVEAGGAGVHAAATIKWRGTGTIEDAIETVFPVEDVGYLSGVDRSYIPKVGALLVLEDTEATFEQLPYILEMNIDNGGPVHDGASAGQPWIYTYTFPTTGSGARRTWTFEGGDDQQAEEFLYGYGRSFGLSGIAGEAWLMTAEIGGRQVAPASFTNITTLQAVEEMIFSKSILSIDDVSDDFGDTPVSNTLISASLKYLSGWQEVYTADGELYFSFTKQVGPEPELEITFEHDTNAVAEIAAWRAGTPRLIRILTEGNAATTPGTVYTYKTMIIDLAGKWSKFLKIGEQNGNDIVTGTFKVAYNETADFYGEIVIVNQLSALA